MIGVLSLGLFACSVLDAEYGAERIRSLEGKKVDELYGSRDLVYSRGFLVVAHHSRSPGLALIDTGSGRVLKFIGLKELPVKLTSDSLGNIFVVQEHYPGASLGALNVFSPVYHSMRLDVTSSQEAHIQVSAGQPLLVQTSKKTISRIRIENGIPALGSSYTAPVLPYGAALVDEGLIFSSNSSEFLFSVDGFGSSGTVDSIPIPFERDSPSAHGGSVPLVSYGDEIFSTFNDGDSSFIVVLDVATRTVVRTIPLHFSHVEISGVLNGRLFLLGRGVPSDIPLSARLDQGVEWIDLQGDSTGGIITTPTQVGGEITRFTPVSQRTGYVLVERADARGKTSIRKITF